MLHAILFAAAILSVTPEREAAALALQDAMSLPAFDRAHQWYLSDYAPEKWRGQTISYTINTVLSQAAQPVLPVPIAGGRLYRLDLRQPFPKYVDRDRFNRNRENLSKIDPYYTAEVLERTPCKPWVASDGRTYDYTSRTVRTFAPHAGHELVELSRQLQTNQPIVRADWLLSKILTSADDGLYYDFAGILKAGKHEKQTDFQKFLKLGGIDREAAIEDRVLERAAIYISGVTGKVRAINAAQGSKARPTTSTGFGSWTEDINDGHARDPRFNPILNLLPGSNGTPPEFDAIEAFIQKRNGYVLMGLFAGRDVPDKKIKAGDLQKEVPPDIAADHTIPSSHGSTRLEACIGCIRCHAPHDMWQPFKNDVVADMQAAPGERKLNIFGDLSAHGRTPEDVFDELSGLYGGDLREPLRLARNAHAAAVFRSTGGLSPSEAARFCSRMFAEYVYESVTTQMACCELGAWGSMAEGAEDSVETAKALFNRMVPIIAGEPAFEHRTIARLRAGGEVGRTDWELVYTMAAQRAENNRVERN